MKKVLFLIFSVFISISGIKLLGVDPSLPLWRFILGFMFVIAGYELFHSKVMK